MFGEGPGTFWGLVVNGMTALGFNTADEQRAYLESVFGMPFASLADAKAFNLQLVSDAYDINQNGLVCAFELRGSRTHLGDAFSNLTFFGLSDDRVGK